ncbi:zinc finger protein 576 [Alligator mississippiensis]|uniref:Zinc finger protein 576 n=2 Tax=Alligator mississippiensis TaxID=8496 RepID=A0A151PG26_ALLMI|nr:zinc finger protein 576 [Alligator mississippiensis]
MSDVGSASPCGAVPLAPRERSPVRTPPPGPACAEEEEDEPKASVASSLYGLGSNQCFHCFITFPDEKFKERHMKREHPEDFVQENLRGTVFVCFICGRAFDSSRALIGHQRGHAPPPAPCPSCHRLAHQCPDCGRRLGPALRPRLGPTTATPTPRGLPHPCPDCGKSFRQLSNLRRHQASHQRPLELLPTRAYACTECGQSFAHEAGLHEHYIRHARGEL